MNVSVSNETWRSNHYPIFIDINLEKYNHTKKSLKTNCTIKTNWEIFPNQLDLAYTNFLSATYLNSASKQKEVSHPKTTTQIIIILEIPFASGAQNVRDLIERSATFKK